jgi:hypothetical protein
MRERDIRERQWFRGLNAPGRALPDKVRDNQTLSGPAGHCPIESLCPGGWEKMIFQGILKFGKRIALRLRIYIAIYKYRSWSSNNHYITLTMMRAT